MKLAFIFDSAAKPAKDFLSAQTMKTFHIEPDDRVLVCEDGTIAYTKHITFDQPYKNGMMSFKLFKDGEYIGHLDVAQNDVPDMYDDQDLADHIWGLVEHGMYHAPQQVKDYVNGEEFDNGAVKGTVKSVNGDEITVTTKNDKDEESDVIVNQQTGEIKPVSDSAAPSDVDELESEITRQLNDPGICVTYIPEGVSDEEAIDIAYAVVNDEFFGSPEPKVYITHEPSRKLHVEL